ncbi:hypothetical protein CRUP_019637, partial [Coryphaenoides rupestris]
PAQMLSVDGCRGDRQVSGRQDGSVASGDQEAHSNAFIRSVPLAEEEDFDSKEWVIIDKEAELRDFQPTTSGTTDEEPEELRPLEEPEERRRIRTSAGELVVRPKTHTRDSSRGMLTLTEEETSRRSGGSPVQSPCHSLPSGRPRRRESDPIGPHRALEEDRHHPRPNQLRRLASYVFSSSTLETEQYPHGTGSFIQRSRSAESSPAHLTASPRRRHGPLQSPGSPRSRHSVLNVMSPTEPTSPDYRTKRQSGEREHFHILPQLQGQRSDLLAVILTGTLPQRRTFAVPPPDSSDPPGPRDDDVTKSESNSEASQKSTEASQEAAPSTLMAEDQRVREPTSDPDLEDVSKTLVLFSPGDPRKSPSGGEHLLDLLAAPCAMSAQTDRPLVATQTDRPLVATQTDSPLMATQTDRLLVATQTDRPLMATQTDRPLMATQTDSPLMATQTDRPLVATQTDRPLMATQTDRPLMAPTDRPLMATQTDRPLNGPDGSQTDRPLVATQTDRPLMATQTDRLLMATQTDRPLMATQTDRPLMATQTDRPLMATQTDRPLVATQTDRPLMATQTDRLLMATQTDRPLMATQTDRPLMATQTDRPLIGQSIQAECAETGRLSPALRFELRPSTLITPASPPFTKVERTFIHIAETSHLNVMSSGTQSVREVDQEVLSHPKESVIELQIHIMKEKTQRGPPSPLPLEPSLTDPPDMTSLNPTSEPVPDAILEESDMKESVSSKNESAVEPQKSIRPKARSRIPVLVSGEDSERSSSTSARAHLQKRARTGDLARLLIQKQQGSWIRKRLLSGTSSSLSSMEEERQKASETLSTTGSEEDTHPSEESRRSSCLRPTEEHGSKESPSRIPRPLTSRPLTARPLTSRPLTSRPLTSRPLTSRLLSPVKGLSDELPATRPSQQSLPGSSFSKGAAATPNRLKKVGTRNSKAHPVRSGSASCPRPPAGSAQAPPLRTIFGIHRSISSSHCRTDSPSPHRLLPTRPAISIRTLPQTPPRTTAPVERGRSRPQASCGAAR